MQRLGPVSVGESVDEQLNLDLKLEMEAVQVLRKAITHCSTVGDDTTRQKLEEIMKSEEGHIDWLETQKEIIDQVGLENYLSEQVKSES